MNKTNINALVQTVERSLQLIHKNRFSIKQYQFLINWPSFFTLPGLKNHTVLRQFVFVDDWSYAFTIWTASTSIHKRARQGERA